MRKIYVCMTYVYVYLIMYVCIFYNSKKYVQMYTFYYII